MSKLIINTADKKSVINKNIYGHFSEHLGRCIYGGYYVGEDSDIPNINGMRKDVIEAMRNIKTPVIRWPGGCFADTYHWMDGVGPKSERKKIVNSHWGGSVEDNSFGTHEFLELCELIGCEPYINGNLGSGTVQEMSEWVEYVTSDNISPMAELRRKNGREEPWKLKYFAVGNENWGCGGNMRPEFYADQYRRYATYLRTGGQERLYKIACGANAEDYRWTEEVMRGAARFMNALSVHYYVWTRGPGKKGSATEFDEEEYYRTLVKALRIEPLIDRHLEIMNYFDPEHKVDMVVDEWGTWHTPEPGTNPRHLYQQNTMRDAIVASISLDIFNARCDRISMANIAQTINVLQAIILTEGEKMILTPTYHVFDLYKEHQGATLLGHWLEKGEAGQYGDESVPMLSATASEKDGCVTITVTNTSATQSTDIDCDILGGGYSAASGRLLTGAMDAMNDFDNMGRVQIRPLDGATLNNGKLSFTLPACSVVEIRLS